MIKLLILNLIMEWDLLLISDMILNQSWPMILSRQQLPRELVDLVKFNQEIMKNLIQIVLRQWLVLPLISQQNLVLAEAWPNIQSNAFMVFKLNIMILKTQNHIIQEKLNLIKLQLITKLKKKILKEKLQKQFSMVIKKNQKKMNNWSRKRDKRERIYIYHMNHLMKWIYSLMQ